MTQLSHSKMDKYKCCPALYKLHYIDRIRSDTLGSALHFGSSIDESLNALLETKLDSPPESATDDLERLKSLFDRTFTFVKINNEIEDIRTSHYIDYFNGDFDEWLLQDEDWESLDTFIRNAGYLVDTNDPSLGEPDPLELLESIRVLKKAGKANSTDLSYFNYCSWLSLRRKGHMMIELYKNEIMPQIKRVISIQKKVTLPNGEGDEIIGYIDFEAEFYDYEGEITADNKTSANKYKLSDVNDKKQLLLYDEYTQNGKAAYIVILKKPKYKKTLTCLDCGEVTSRSVRSCAAIDKSVLLLSKPSKPKRCGGELEIHKEPYLEYQILVDDIDEEKKDLLFEEICDILEQIENEEFPQNRDSCFQYGRNCPYYSLCRSDPANLDYTGLVRKNE